uniref:Uncharacterized protein n=1 Tax=Oryza rufipogon TaxID=4529 RepID=A0A0E0REK1_ORYRU
MGRAAAHPRPDSRQAAWGQVCPAPSCVVGCLADCHLRCACAHEVAKHLIANDGGCLPCQPAGFSGDHPGVDAQIASGPRQCGPHSHEERVGAMHVVSPSSIKRGPCPTSRGTSLRKPDSGKRLAKP